MSIELEIRNIIAKIEINYNYDIWRDRFKNLLNIILNVTINNKLEEYKSLKEVLILENLIEIYKITNDNGLNYYLNSIPRYNSNELHNTTIEQHGYVAMQRSFYKDKKAEKIVYVNNYETFIYFDSATKTYIMTYLGEAASFKEYKNLEQVISILIDNKLTDYKALQMATMLSI